MKSHVAVYVLVLLLIVAGCSRKPEQLDNSGTSAAGAPAAPSSAVTITSSPSTGSGAEQVFEIKAVTNPGAALPSLIGLLVNSTMSGGKACYVYGAVADGKLMLVNDSGVGTKPLIGASIANTQCELVQNQSSVSVFGTDVIVKAHLRFKPAFVGPKKLYLIAYDQRQVTDGLRPVGQWEVTVR